MNKTISINLGGRNFFIEEEAYKKLESYLNAIKARFAEYAGSAEIVADMEARIGEKFGEKYGAGSQAVISAADVDNLIKELGSVEDIAGEEGKKGNADEKTSGQSFAPKRLMRNGDDKIIAGVASGLAAYFNIDPIIPRLIFGLLLFAGGSVIPIYLLLWLIMPEAKTATEKMQMRGQALNLDSISETIKERAEEFKEHVSNVKKNEDWKKWGEGVKDKAKSVGQEMGEAGKKGGRGLGNFLGALFRVIGKIIRFFVLFIVKIIALAFVVAMGAAIIGLTVSVVAALFNSNSPYIGFPIAAITHNAAFYVLLIAAYVIVLVPLQLLMLLALSALIWRKVLRAPATMALLGFWFLALIVGAALGGRYVPMYVDQVRNSPQLQTVSRTFEAKDFNKVDLGNSLNYKLVQGKEFGVKASGWSADLDRLNVRVDNGTLRVSRNSMGFCVFCFSGSPTVEITAPDFVSIVAENSSTVGSDSIVATTTSLSLANSSEAKINFKVKELTLNLENSSYANLSGSADVMKAKLYNSSDLRAGSLVVKDAEVTTANSSQANLNVTGTLKYTSFNSSQIYYTGNPQITTDRGASYFENPPIPEIPRMDD